MNRRSFMQSLSAAMGALAFGVTMPRVQRPPKIRYDLFTDTRVCPRYQLTEPVSQAGGIYATDSRILITHPGEWSGDGTARVPDFSRLWWEEFDKPGWKLLGRDNRRKVSDEMMCPQCMGVGRVGADVRKCAACNGDWDRYGVKCEECERGWVGGSLCAACNGSKWIDDDAYRVVLDGEQVCPAYIARLRTLGDVEWRLTDPVESRYSQWNHSDRHRVVLVRAENDVRGMLMPMSRE